MSGTRHWELNLLPEAFPKCHFRKLSKPCNLASEGRLENGAHPSHSQDFQPVNNVSLILFIMLGFSIFLLCQRNIIEIINITIAYHLSNASKLRSYGWTCNYTFCYYYRISLEKHWVLTLESILSQPDRAAILNSAQPSIQPFKDYSANTSLRHYSNNFKQT